MIGAPAAVLDSLDGRIARMLDATSKLGAELDSLADAISFGVAPALVLYVTLLDGNNFGGSSRCCAAVSQSLRWPGSTRCSTDDTVPAYTKDFFVGVPAPAAPWIALTPLAVSTSSG